MKIELKEKIAGEISLSDEPGVTIRKWREAFDLSQQELAQELGISPSVISDYESGRRKSPGVATVKKIVDALINLDEKAGGRILKRYESERTNKAILSMKEFPVPIQAEKFVASIKGKNLSENALESDVHGYTVIDSLKAILSLDSSDYLKIYGWSSQRALIFTGVKYGRSPMVAIRAHPLKPAMVVFHSPDRVDHLAIKLANLERIPLVVTDLSMQALISNLMAL
ncbi:MAG: helix-turn-helix domain-containing protein [Methanomassiliicoccales archaeon]|nr:MAG: helix-turn-helix domain-containing protein [Methanomassiliicoccales archaeon]